MPFHQRRGDEPPRRARQDPCLFSLENFSKLLSASFCQHDVEQAADEELWNLAQGELSVVDYTLRVRLLITNAGYSSDKWAVSAFHRDLSLEIRSSMVKKSSPPSTLERVMEATFAADLGFGTTRTRVMNPAPMEVAAFSVPAHLGTLTKHALDVVFMASVFASSSPKGTAHQ